MRRWDVTFWSQVWGIVTDVSLQGRSGSGQKHPGLAGSALGVDMAHGQEGCSVISDLRA